MKKILLSSILIGAFAFYVFWQHLNGSQNNYSVVPDTASSSNSTSANVVYKDGQYIGNVADAYYGNIQTKAIIQNGKITDVQFLNYPQDRSTSVRINTRAMPILKTETIQAQSAQVNIVSGATDTSQAFRQSLSAALKQAV